MTTPLHNPRCFTLCLLSESLTVILASIVYPMWCGLFVGLSRGEIRGNLTLVFWYIGDYLESDTIYNNNFGI